MTQQIEKLLERAVLMLERLERVLPQPLSQPDWHEAIAWRYRKRASGHGVLEAVRHVSDMGLQDLQEIDGQKEKLKQNTLQFVHGLPANNVLLTGSRGTGKSSLIKACLNAYASQGLRLIEVDKEDLTDLPDIVDVVAGRPEKFIIFCDDYSSFAAMNMLMIIQAKATYVPSGASELHPALCTRCLRRIKN